MSAASREVVGESAIGETEALDDLFIEEGKALKSFLYELAKYAYKPHGYEGHGENDTHGYNDATHYGGHGHGQGHSG